MDYITQGIVIREVLQGENDKLLTILTSEYGKITAYAKGVKKISSKNAPACQLFVYSEYELLRKFGRLTVKTALPKEMFYEMRADMTRYSLACYFADVLNHICVENNDETEPLRLFLNCLYALSNKKDIPLTQIKSVFELKLMCICGFMPNLNYCFNCGAENSVLRNNVFSFEESGILCDECFKNAGNSVIPYCCTVSSDVLEILKYISLSPQSKMLMFSLSDDKLKELAFVCENYLIHKTERSYETLKIYKSIIN